MEVVILILICIVIILAIMVILTGGNRFKTGKHYKNNVRGNSRLGVEDYGEIRKNQLRYRDLAQKQGLSEYGRLKKKPNPNIPTSIASVSKDIHKGHHSNRTKRSRVARRYDE